MQFSSLDFAAFFAIVFAVYWAMPWARLRIWWLLAASIYFYASWSAMLALLVVGTSAMDYLLARGMDRWSSPRLRKTFLYTSLIVNLGLLCYFKYVNFFLDSLRTILTSHGLASSIPSLEILVPFGISFYTFEAISYTIDVYRGRMKAETNLANFMLFILFFPHLVAGPIVRAWDFLPQARRTKRWSWFRLSLGAQLFALGLFKKLAISDNLALFSDPIFENPALYKTQTLWLGTIAFAIRIWADFSGYSDMALGTAHALGFKLTKNFNLPYLSLNVAEFWRRWHISLSTWLRDYLFIPLGGSRGSTLMTCRNLMITMALGGLWHGANWSFLLWGVAHGAFLVVHKLFRDWCQPRPTIVHLLDTPVGKFARWLLTFVCVVLAWTMFQPSIAVGLTILKGMFTLHGGNPTTVPSIYMIAAFLVILLGHLIAKSPAWHQSWRRCPASLAGSACGVVFLLALLLSPSESKVFIYFQF